MTHIDKYAILINMSKYIKDLRDDLDDAISEEKAVRLIGKETYHPQMSGGKGTIVKVNGNYYIRGKVKCARKGCTKYRVLYFGSGCHSGAFCYAYNPRTKQFLGDFRNVEYRCENHI